MTDEERAKCIPDCVLVEPHTKQELGLSRNKAWPWDRWQRLVDGLKLPWVQMGPPGTKRLEGVQFVETPRFRDTLGYLNRAALIVTTDGALHHAAAALDKPAVVIWGGATDPDILGYRTHRNIRADVDTCGSIKDCGHCRAAMQAVSVGMVKSEVRDLSER